MTVLTADWGFEKRVAPTGEKTAAERSPFGWRHRENEVETIYLPTWLHYRQVSWNPALNSYCRARLGEFDIAHIFGLYDLLEPAAAEACRKRAIPYVVEPIGMFIPILRNLWLKRMYHGVWAGRMLGGASAVVATSEKEIAELTAGGIPKAKIVMRRNGVQAPEPLPRPGGFRKKLGIPDETKIVLFLGRLSAKKSPDLLLRAFVEVYKQLPRMPLRLVFAGPDESGLRTQLEQMVSQLGIARDVQFAGPVFDQEKWAAYRDAHVFVLPSRNENFGNTAAEAVASGTPVIVTEQCGIAPLLANEAGLVVKHDVENLAETLSYVLMDDKLRRQLQAGCAKVALHLGLAEPVGKREELYSDYISGGAEHVETKELE